MSTPLPETEPNFDDPATVVGIEMQPWFLPVVIAAPLACCILVAVIVAVCLISGKNRRATAGPAVVAAPAADRTVNRMPAEATGVYATFSTAAAPNTEADPVYSPPPLSFSLEQREQPYASPLISARLGLYEDARASTIASARTNEYEQPFSPLT
jgi:hypothetical protein